MLSVHAHPDDEASKGAATMARYHAEGVRTVLVTCTGGEAGDILNPAADTEDVRRDLARGAHARARRRGADHRLRRAVPARLPRLGHARHRANAHPDNFANADLDEATGRLVRDRPPRTAAGDRRLRTTTACYAHPDHVRVHEISVLAFERAGDPEWYPELGEPWQPLKLYYSNGFTRQRIRALHDWFVAQGDESPLAKWVEHMDERDAAAAASPTGAGDGHDDAARAGDDTTRVDVRDQIEVGRAALLAHRTQIPADSFFFRVPARGGAGAPPLGGVRAGALARRSGRLRRRVRDRPLRGAQGGGEPLSAPMPPDDRERSELDEALFSARSADPRAGSRAAAGIP